MNRIGRLAALVMAMALMMTWGWTMAEDMTVIPEEDGNVVALPGETPAPMLAAGSAAGLTGVDNRYLMLASAAEPLAETYVPMNLQTVPSRRNDNKGVNENGGLYLASSTTMQLVDTALTALSAMFSAAEGEGVTLYLRQGYRSYAEEGSRYERMVARGTPSEIPGQSDYQTGLAVTVVSKSLRTRTLTAEEWLATVEGQWVTANCARFGFIVRYPQGQEDMTGHDAEPWHLRYVGESVATYMARNNMTLEAFRMELDASAGAYVMPEGSAQVRTTWQPSSAAIRASATEVPRVSPTPVPDTLPGGAQLLEETADGDWEFSLFDTTDKE
ncbi:MAG: M15 family metallopeptidase [Aristaeellaceae bacterium]